MFWIRVNTSIWKLPLPNLVSPKKRLIVKGELNSLFLSKTKSLFLQYEILEKLVTYIDHLFLIPLFSCKGCVVDNENTQHFVNKKFILHFNLLFRSTLFTNVPHSVNTSPLLPPPAFLCASSFSHQIFLLSPFL